MKDSLTIGPVSRCFWNLYGVVYDAIWDSPIYDRIAEEVECWLSDSSTILDLGCGSGLISYRISGRVRTVTGVDFEGVMLNRARARSSEAVSIATLNSLANDRNFDITILVNVLHTCDDPRGVLEAGVLHASQKVLAIWPVDKVNLRKLFEWEVALGGSLLRATRSLVLRILIGIPGQFLGIRKTGERKLRSISKEVAQQLGLDVEFRSIEFSGCELAAFTIPVGTERICAIQSDSKLLTSEMRL